MSSANASNAASTNLLNRTGWLILAAACSSLSCSGSSGTTIDLPPAGIGGTASALGGSSTVGGAVSKGGAVGLGGSPAAVGNSATGGIATTGGTSSYGGNVTGGASSGGAATGGASSLGGAATGGKASAGAATGGASVGGAATGGSATGGAATGGASVGGAATGGKATGGAATGGAATGGAGVGGSDLLVPANGAWLGVFTPAQSQAEIATKETQIGRKFAIHLGYFDWSLDYTAFARADIAAGRIPYVTVEPHNVTLAAIANGSQDAIIQSRATSIKALTGKVMLRFAHEMNGNWYPWDGSHNGSNAAATAAYIAAYRHIKDVFVAAGVTNVLWVFCPNVNSVPNVAWNTWQSYYPGDAYVDWMCFDGYDWGGGTFTALTSTIYSQFVAANSKPIMLGETSSPLVEKAVWINGILPAMQSQFPMLKALVWFDVNIGTANNYLYSSSAASLAAFTAMANDPYFNP